MIHLGEVLSDHERKQLRCDASWDLHDAEVVAADACAAAEHAMCFDMGDMLQFVGMRGISALVKLPFPVCWFEGVFPDSHGPSTVGFLCRELDTPEHKGLRTIQFVKSAGHWSLLNVSFWTPVTEEEGALTFAPPSSRAGDICAHDHQFLRVFLSAMNCANVERIQHPRRDTRKHRKQKHKPVFSYWTLHVRVPAAGLSDSLGGTHASPRVHLRRGHFRQYADGQYCWVQPHVVGRKSQGMVHKDYKVRCVAG